MRAERLWSTRSRKQLADGLERAVAQAEAVPTLTAAAPVAREDVCDERALMLEIARRLRSSDPVDPRGVLLVRRLLSDPASPLAPNAQGVSLQRALRDANAALTPT